MRLQSPLSCLARSLLTKNGNRRICGRNKVTLGSCGPGVFRSRTNVKQRTALVASLLCVFLPKLLQEIFGNGTSGPPKVGLLQRDTHTHPAWKGQLETGCKEVWQSAKHGSKTSQNMDALLLPQIKYKAPPALHSKRLKQGRANCLQLGIYLKI